MVKFRYPINLAVLHILVSIIAFNKSLHCVHKELVNICRQNSFIPCISTVPSFKTRTFDSKPRAPTSPACSGMAAQKAVASPALSKVLLGVNLLSECSPSLKCAPCIKALLRLNCARP